MRHRLPASLVVLVLAVACAACGGADGSDATDGSTPTSTASAPKGDLTVFAAASLTDAFTEIGEAFEAANPGTSVTFSFGPSSGLREQILDGAPADVYASANRSNVDQVIEGGAATESEVFATNALEIAVPAGNPAEVSGLEDFADASLFLGLCAEEVPCGEFGREALANAGVTPSIDTEADDVRALLVQVASGDLDAGIVYRSDVQAADADVDGVEIPAEDNVVADYPLATLTESARPELAEAFVAFVLGDDGQQILARYGFGPP